MKNLRARILILVSLMAFVIGTRIQAQTTNAAPADASTAATGAPIRVACVGDSITVGVRSTNPYPKQLQGMLGAQYQVKNFGVGGRTLTKKGDLPYWKEKAFQNAKDFQPNVVVIMLGTNDVRPANLPNRDGFHDDYKELVETFKNLASKPKVFICLPTPIFNKGSYGITEANLETEFPIIKQVATEEGVSLIDLHTPLDGKTGLSIDNVHPNAEGDTILAHTVADALAGKTAATP